MKHERTRRPSRSRAKSPLHIFPTTLWEYESQHYTDTTGISEQGDRDYAGATPSWVIWQVLSRYTRPRDLVVDPMCGSGTTIDVARDLDRRALGYDLAPPQNRRDIFRADARRLPLEDAKADFVFIDPPYSTHIHYSDDPRCIGRLNAGGPDRGRAYFDSMDQVFSQIHRILRPGHLMALYVSDSYQKTPGSNTPIKRPAPHTGKSAPTAPANTTADDSPLSWEPAAGEFMPIGFMLFSRLIERFEPIDIIAVVRKNQKLSRGNWRAAAQRENFFLRGFNYLFILRKALSDTALNTSSVRTSARHPLSR